MALNPLRWIAAAVAACLLAIAYFYTPAERAPRPGDQRDAIVTRERQLAFAATLAADRLRASIVIDSLRRSWRGMPAGDTLRLLIDRSIPASVRPAFRGAAERALAAIGNPRLPVDLAIVLDTLQTVRGVTRSAGQSVTADHVLPLTDRDRCLSIIRIRAVIPAGDAERELSHIASRLVHRRLLGPCAFVGTFGRPGPHVAEWLARSAWGFSLVAGWSRHSPKWSPPAWYGTGDTSDGWPLRYYMGIDAYRCATGQQRACDVAVAEVGPAQRRNALPHIWGRRIISTAQTDNEWYYRLSLGPRHGTFLSDLVNEVGMDRFRRFWTSRDPVAQAFESATGRTLGAATYDWTQAQYAGFVGRGAAVSPLTAGLALLFIGGGAAAAMAAARRRSVR